MNLQDRLDAHKTEFRKKAPVEALEIMDRATRNLVESGLADRAVGVGDCFPGFSLPGLAIDKVELGELLTKGPLIATVYRGVW